MMVRSSYLRVYQALSTFSEEEQRRWTPRDEIEAIEPGDLARWIVRTVLPTEPSGRAPEGVFLRELSGTTFVCPWRTRLRMLTGLISFRGSIDEEVADAFVPRAEAEKAAEELADIAARDPDVRSYILHANWHVPLRWFAAFDGSERVLLEDRDGVRIRYETSLSEATTRLDRALKVLEASWIDEQICDAVRELRAWLGGFSEPALLELDYASVAGIFDDDALVDDHSVVEVWSCLDALAAGDVVRAGRVFATLTDRWAAARAHEVLN